MSERDRFAAVNAGIQDVREGWSSLLPSAFVIVALLALLIVPISVQGRLDFLQAEIDEIGEPARDLIAEVEYLVARQSSARRGYLITGDAEFVQRYETLAAQERALYPR
ncbi:MAG: CHASE3 domain-containing protein, partial [Gemmatimonadota bacterium]